MNTTAGILLGDPEVASSVADALAYFLAASEDNFGSGWACGDEAFALKRDRAHVEAVLAALTVAEAVS